MSLPRARSGFGASEHDVLSQYGSARRLCYVHAADTSPGTSRTVGSNVFGHLPRAYREWDARAGIEARPHSPDGHGPLTRSATKLERLTHILDIRTCIGPCRHFCSDETRPVASVHSMFAGTESGIPTYCRCPCAAFGVSRRNDVTISCRRREEAGRMDCPFPRKALLSNAFPDAFTTSGGIGTYAFVAVPISRGLRLVRPARDLQCPVLQVEHGIQRVCV